MLFFPRFVKKKNTYIYLCNIENKFSEIFSGLSANLFSLIDSIYYIYAQRFAQKLSLSWYFKELVSFDHTPTQRFVRGYFYVDLPVDLSDLLAQSACNFHGNFLWLRMAPFTLVLRLCSIYVHVIVVLAYEYTSDCESSWDFDWFSWYVEITGNIIANREIVD